MNKLGVETPEVLKILSEIEEFQKRIDDPKNFSDCKHCLNLNILDRYDILVDMGFLPIHLKRTPIMVYNQ